MKHIHADLIKAWADGAIIEEYRPNLDQWVKPEPYPIWDARFAYRVKSAPKEDTVAYYYADSFNRLHLMNFDNSPDLKITFDGETGLIKSAEVIK
jgi:hypothetical protein